MKALYVMSEDIYYQSFDEETKNEIAALLGEKPGFVTGEYMRDNPGALKGAEILFTSYGACFFDERILAHADKLKIIFHAAGTVKLMVGRHFWDSGILIANAACANAPAVAEFAFAQILLSLKRFFFHSRNYKENKEYKIYEMPGAFKTDVGLISYGVIAKELCRLLKSVELNIHIYSPELDEKSAAKDGLIFTPLDRIFEICDVVSLHTPMLPQTEKMIKERHFLSMKQNAAFINTARGGVVDEDGMISALRKRPDLTALLDVTAKEPLPEDSALFTLQNVVLTPHIAGSYFKEKNRLGYVVLGDLKRYLNGQELQHRVKEEDLINMA